MTKILSIAILTFSLSASASPIKDLGRIQDFNIDENCANADEIHRRMDSYDYMQISYLRVFPNKQKTIPATACWIETEFEHKDADVFKVAKQYFGRVIYVEKYEDIPGEAIKRQKHAAWVEKNKPFWDTQENITPGVPTDGFGGGYLGD